MDKKRDIFLRKHFIINILAISLWISSCSNSWSDDLLTEIRSLKILIIRQSDQYSPKTASSGSRFYPIIKRAADRYRLDPRLIQAIIHVESGNDPGAVSKKGAVGLMQLMPSTAREIGVTRPFDPYQNVMGGSYYYRKMLSLHRGDHRKALWSYHCGPGCVERGEVPRESKEYANRTLRVYKNLKRKEIAKK